MARDRRAPSDGTDMRSRKSSSKRARTAAMSSPGTATSMARNQHGFSRRSGLRGRNAYTSTLSSSEGYTTMPVMFLRCERRGAAARPISTGDIASTASSRCCLLLGSMAALICASLYERRVRTVPGTSSGGCVARRAMRSMRPSGSRQRPRTVAQVQRPKVSYLSSRRLPPSPLMR